MGERVCFTKLSNGLTVHLIPKEDYYETYGIITAKFGSVDTRILVNGVEKQYPAGIAHFLEHKLFEDEKGQDFLKRFVQLGSESNAFTSFTKTSYLFSTTSKVTENIQLLLEMVSKASFTEKTISKEREIIQQEIGMYQDSPDYQLFFGALEQLYPATSLADDIAGTKESIANITTENLHENFDLFYHPSQMHLLVIGNFDVDSVCQVLKDYEKETPRQSIKLERIPVEKNEVVLNQSSRMNVAIPKLAIAIRGNDLIQKEETFRYKLMLKLLFSMMFGWTSQRFQSLYEAGKIDNSLTLEVEVEELLNQSSRMNVAIPKLAIAIRGNDLIQKEETFRYKLMLKLLFSMMFGWTSQRFQSLYEAGKIDNSLTLEVEVEELFHFVILTMDTQEPVSVSHQFRKSIRQFEKDPDVNQEHLDTIKSEMFGDFLQGLNSLEYSATQFEYFSNGSTSYDLPKILQSISLQDIIRLGHQFIDQAEMIDYMIFSK